MCIKGNSKEKTSKRAFEFSKLLILQESILVWIITIAFVILAFISVLRDYTGELGWLVTLSTSIWVAYGVSQAFYYNKAKKENTRGGVKYLAVANELGVIENENNELEQPCDEDESEDAEG